MPSRQQILLGWMKARGLDAAEVADLTGFTRRAIDNFVKGRSKFTSPATMAILAGALGEDVLVLLDADGPHVERKRLDKLLEAVMKSARSMGVASEARGESKGGNDTKVAMHPSLPFARSLDIGIPIDVLFSWGIKLDVQSRPAEAVQILDALAHPDDGLLYQIVHKPIGLVMSEVATGHLGHSLMDIGDYAGSAKAFNRALYLLDREEGMDRHEVANGWNMVQPLDGRTREDFRSWCLQMLAVVEPRSNGNRGILDLAIGRLNYVERYARATSGPALIRGNALRDRASLKMRINPRSSEAGSDFGESIANLKDTEDESMLAMSLVRRAEWHRQQGDSRGMETDAAAAMAAIQGNQSIVKVNLFNSVAELYLPFDPEIAGMFAKKALVVAQQQGGYEGQRTRSVAILTRLEDKKGKKT